MQLPLAQLDPLPETEDGISFPEDGLHTGMWMPEWI